MINIQLNHSPVLLDETISSLSVKPDGIYIDGTFGCGGHSRALLAKLSNKGSLVGIDKDPFAMGKARKLSMEDGRFSIKQCSFANLAKVVGSRLWNGQVNGIILDIGVSSPQLDVAERGFSFHRDGFLDMRMNPNFGISAAEWLARATMDDIVTVIKTFGEERYGKSIARAIVEMREITPIVTTLQLAELVYKASPLREINKHPATRTFQAIRIYINNELEELEIALEEALNVLALGGRLAVISFHSLEDRIIKRFFKNESRGDDLPYGFPITVDQLNPRIKLVGKIIKANDRELVSNSRARSAILRVIERLV